MSSYTNVFGGLTISPAQVFYASYTLSANLQLIWSTSFGAGGNNVNNVAFEMDVTATNTGFNLIMPDATQVSVGISFFLNNVGSNSFTLMSFDGTTPIATIAPSTFSYFYLINNSTSNGTWRQALIAGGTAVTSVGVTTSGTGGNIITSGSPITTSGTISLTLGADLSGLTGLGVNTGIAVRQNTTGTWSTVALTGTANQILMTNGSGVAGNPTIALAPAISGLTSINLNSGGNLSLGVTPNTIAATNASGILTLLDNGGGINIGNSATNGLTLNSNTVIQAKAALFLQKNSTLYFSDAASANFVGLNVATPITGYTIDLPGAIGSVGQVLSISSITGSFATLNWGNVPSFPGSSITNTIPVYTNTTGALGDSTVTITSSNVLGNISTLNVGSLQLASSTSTIGSTSGNMFLSVPGGDLIGSLAPIYMLNSKPLYFSTSLLGTDHYLGFQPPAVISTNTLWTLPAADGTSGQFLSTNGAGTLSWGAGNSGTVTSITAGTNLTGGTITSTGTIALGTTLTGLTSASMNNLITSPTGGLTTPTLSLGTAYQNTTGHDIVMVVNLNITVNASGADTISLGVGSTNTPTQQTIFTGVTIIGLLPVTIYLPNNYYALLSISGLTASIVGQYAMPV